MKLLLSILVVFLALAEVFCEEVGQNEDLNHWTNSIQIQDEWLASDALNEILKRITRKPRPRQFFGLMGKRSYANAQITRKMYIQPITHLLDTLAFVDNITERQLSSECIAAEIKGKN